MATAERLARLSCTTCKRQKRKCSRELPACQLCRKNRRTCEYSAEAYETDNAVLEYHGSSSQGSELRNDFPRIFFLDSYTSGLRRCVVPRPSDSLPLEFAGLRIDDPVRMRGVVDGYFDRIHPFLPFISKIRTYQQLSSTPPSADLVLLVACMGLFNVDQGDPSTTTPSPPTTIQKHYTKTKRLASHLESQGQISQLHLQATMLLALYELAHAIHPAAYLTIGHSTRLAHAMGLHDRRHASQMLGSTASWTELEEQRRVCWALLVLDRYVNIGLGGRPSAWQDAQPDDLLPQDEEVWEAGGRLVSQALAVSGPSSITPNPSLPPAAEVTAAPFARTCQAADLLSRVQHHTDQHPSGAEMATWYRDAIQLHHILTAFRTAVEEEYRDATTKRRSLLRGAMGICYSAQMALHDIHSCAEKDAPEGRGLPEQLECQRVALRGMVATREAVRGLAMDVVLTSEGEDDVVLVVSPFVVDCMYAAALNYLAYWKECLSGELVGPLVDICRTLVVVGRRWNVANEYILILEGEGLRSIPDWNVLSGV